MRDPLELASRLARCLAGADGEAIAGAGAALLAASAEAFATGDVDQAQAIAELAVALCQLRVDAAVAGGQRPCPAG